MRAGRAGYFSVTDTVEWDNGPDDRESYTSYNWYRMRPDGTVYFVLGFTASPSHDDPLRFTGEADGSITVTGATGRTQRLRWDEAAFRLVPAGV